MQKSSYDVQLEVSGPMAIWARPDTALAPVSYPAPTQSAARGLLESIAWFRSGAWFAPYCVEICKPVGAAGGLQTQRYTTNYGGPLRKSDHIKKGANGQLAATILTNVCYRIYATIEGDWPANGRNPRHHLQDLFNRRLRQGRSFRKPSLGWSEFGCDYWGPFRDTYEVDETINLTLPAMLTSTFDNAPGSPLAPRWAHDVEIAHGVLHYAS